MDASPNNFLEDSDEQSNFAETNFLAFSSPFTNFNDNETPSDILFYSSTHSSINYHSDQFNPYFGSECGKITRLSKQKPFKIIRATQKGNEGMTNILKNSKRIKKQCVPKKRLKPKQEIADLLLKAPQKFIPDGIEDPDIDDRERRRLMQKLKNRLSAQLTRDQRRQKISELEEINMLLEMANKELNEKNKLLNDKNKELEERLEAVKNEKLVLLEENEKLKQTGEVGKCNEDPEGYFNFSGDKHEESRFSPQLTRKRNHPHHDYFNFLLGVIMLCAILRPSENVTDIELNIDEPLISHSLSTEHNEIRFAPFGVSEEGSSLTLGSQSFDVGSNKIKLFYYSMNAGYAPLRTAESKFSYCCSSIYYNTELNFVPVQMFEGSSLVLRSQSTNTGSNEMGRFYFVIRNGLGPLRSAENELNYVYKIDDETGCEKFIRKIKKENASLTDLLYLFTEFRVVLLIFLVSLLLCSFITLEQSIQYNTFESHSQLNMIKDKEIEFRKKRIKELQYKASSWKSEFQFYCAEIRSEEIF